MSVVIVVVGGKFVLWIGLIGDGYVWVKKVGYIIIEFYLIEVLIMFSEFFIK